MSDNPIVQQLAAYQLGRQRDLYARTGNPWHAVRAYRDSRAAGVPVPEWVLEYLDRAFAAVDEASTGREIAQALALVDAKGGQGNGQRRAETQSRNTEIVRTIQILRRRGCTLTEACEKEADRHGLEVETVEKIWKKTK